MIHEIFVRLQAAHWMAGEFWLKDSLLFCALLATSQIFLVPVTPFAIFAGFVLGFPKAFLLLFVAKLLSATLNFTLSRYAGRAWVQRLTTRSHILASFHTVLGGGAFKEALLVRLCPIPFAVLNYCCGITNLHLATFLGSAAIGILPPTLIFCALGASFQGSGLLPDAETTSRSPWQTGLFVTSLLVSLWLARTVSRRALQNLKLRRAL